MKDIKTSNKRKIDFLKREESEISSLFFNWRGFGRLSTSRLTSSCPDCCLNEGENELESGGIKMPLLRKGMGIAFCGQV